MPESTRIYSLFSNTIEGLDDNASESTIAKVQTQAQLLARWKDQNRLDSIIVYMTAVEWEIKHTLEKLQLEVNQ